MKLYDLSDDILALQDIEADGEQSLEEAIKNSIEELQLDFNSKADNIARLNFDMLGDIQKIENEIKRLQSRKTGMVNSLTGMKKYLLDEMQRIGKKKIVTDLYTLTSVKGRVHVVIDDPDELDDKFIKIKMEESPDKKLIMVALKDGEVVGAHAEQSDNSLRIK